MPFLGNGSEEALRRCWLSTAGGETAGISTGFSMVSMRSRSICPVLSLARSGGGGRNLRLRRHRSASILDDFDEPAVLVGHSFGGRVAVQTALSRPDGVGRFGSCRRAVAAPPPSGQGGAAPSLPNSSNAGKDGSGRQRSDGTSPAASTVPPTTGPHTASCATSSLPSSMRATKRTLDRISQSVRLIWGANDTDVPVETAQRAMEHLSRADLTVLEKG